MIEYPDTQLTIKINYSRNFAAVQQRRGFTVKFL